MLSEYRHHVIIISSIMTILASYNIEKLEDILVIKQHLTKDHLHAWQQFLARPQVFNSTKTVTARPHSDACHVSHDPDPSPLRESRSLFFLLTSKLTCPILDNS